MYYSELLFNNLFSKIAPVSFVFKKHSDKSISNYKIYFNKRSTDKCANTVTTSFDKYINKYININKDNEVVSLMSDSQVIVEFEDSTSNFIFKINKLKEKLKNISKQDSQVFSSIHVYGESINMDILIEMKKYNATITDTFDKDSYYSEAFNNFNEIVSYLIESFLEKNKCYLVLKCSERKENKVVFKIEIISSTTMIAFIKHSEAALNKNKFTAKVDYIYDL
jgi:hypothetical protein